MKAYHFEFTITGITKMQAGVIWRNILNVINVLKAKRTSTEEIDLAGSFREEEYEQEEVPNV